MWRGFRKSVSLVIAASLLGGEGVPSDRTANGPLSGSIDSPAVFSAEVLAARSGVHFTILNRPATVRVMQPASDLAREPIVILIPRPLQTFFVNRAEMAVRATTLGEAMKALFEAAGSVHQEPVRRLLSRMNIFVNGERITGHLWGSVSLQPSDEVTLVPSIAGGESDLSFSPETAFLEPLARPLLLESGLASAYSLGSADETHVFESNGFLTIHLNSDTLERGEAAGLEELRKIVFRLEELAHWPNQRPDNSPERFREFIEYFMAINQTAHHWRIGAHSAAFVKALERFANAFARSLNDQPLLPLDPLATERAYADGQMAPENFQERLSQFAQRFQPGEERWRMAFWRAFGQHVLSEANRQGFIRSTASFFFIDRITLQVVRAVVRGWSLGDREPVRRPIIDVRDSRGFLIPIHLPYTEQDGMILLDSDRLDLQAAEEARDHAARVLGEQLPFLRRWTDLEWQTVFKRFVRKRLYLETYRHPKDQPDTEQFERLLHLIDPDQTGQLFLLKLASAVMEEEPNRIKQLSLAKRVWRHAQLLLKAVSPSDQQYALKKLYELENAHDRAAYLLLKEAESYVWQSHDLQRWRFSVENAKRYMKQVPPQRLWEILSLPPLRALVSPGIDPTNRLRRAA